MFVLKVFHVDEDFEKETDSNWVEVARTESKFGLRPAIREMREQGFSEVTMTIEEVQTVVLTPTEDDTAQQQVFTFD